MELNSTSICSVRTCHSPSNLVYHCFPKDTARRKLWINACRRKDLQAKTPRICMKHFEESCYVRDLRNEMLGLPLRKLLKGDAIPTLNMGPEENPLPTPFKEEQQMEKKEVYVSILKANPPPFQIGAGFSIPVWQQNLAQASDVKPSTVESSCQTSSKLSLDASTQACGSPVKKHSKASGTKDPLMQELRSQKLKNAQLQETIKNLQSENKKLKSNHYVREKVQRELEKCFTTTQAKLIVNGKSSARWDAKDVSQALALQSISPKAYQYIRSSGLLPVPSESTLKRWSRNSGTLISESSAKTEGTTDPLTQTVDTKTNSTDMGLIMEVHMDTETDEEMETGDDDSEQNTDYESDQELSGKMKNIIMEGEKSAPGGLCLIGCRMSCRYTISLQRQHEIWEQFWSLPFDKRRLWTYNFVSQTPREGKRQPLYSFYLPTSKNDRIQVCRKMFNRTLGYHDRINLFKLMKRTEPEALTPLDDKTANPGSTPEIDHSTKNSQLQVMNEDILNVDPLQQPSPVTAPPPATDTQIPDDPIQYTTGKKGALNVIWMGYRYSKDRNRDYQKSYWRCTLRNQGCPGRLTLHGNTPCNSPLHNHPEQQDEIAVHLKKQSLKRSAASSSIKTKDLVTLAAAGLDSQARSKMNCSISSLERMARRSRKKAQQTLQTQPPKSIL